MMELLQQQMQNILSSKNLIKCDFQHSKSIPSVTTMAACHSYQSINQSIKLKMFLKHVLKTAKDSKKPV